MEAFVIALLNGILATLIYDVFKAHLDWRSILRFFSRVVRSIFNGNAIAIILKSVLFLFIIFLLVITFRATLLPWYIFSFQDGRDFITCLLIFLSPVLGLFVLRFIYKYAASEESKIFLFIAKFLTLTIFLYSVWILIPVAFQNLGNIAVFQWSLEQKDEIEKLAGIKIHPLSTIAGSLFVGVILELLERFTWEANRRKKV